MSLLLHHHLSFLLPRHQKIPENELVRESGMVLTGPHPQRKKEDNNMKVSVMRVPKQIR